MQQTKSRTCQNRFSIRLAMFWLQTLLSIEEQSEFRYFYKQMVSEDQYILNFLTLALLSRDALEIISTRKYIRPRIEPWARCVKAKTLTFDFDCQIIYILNILTHRHYGIQRFITARIQARHVTLSRASVFQSPS